MLKSKKAQQQACQRLLSDSRIGEFIKKLPGLNYRQFEKISSLQQLKALYLCRKLITQLPAPQQNQLPSLQVIWLNSNSIKDVKLFFQYLPQIRQIYLNYNQIQRLEGYEKCSKLQKLNLSYNQISRIPQDLYLPASLKTILLTKNNLQSVQLLINLKLPNLESLYLCYNNLTTARVLRKMDCPKLRNLYLQNNHIIDFWRYDDILMDKLGNIDLINTAKTRDEPDTTKIKFGIIRSPRFRALSAQIFFS